MRAAVILIRGKYLIWISYGVRVGVEHGVNQKYKASSVVATP